MNVDTGLQNVSRVLLDTAPVIYFVEKNPRYFSLVAEIFDRIDKGDLEAITTPVTLAEALVIPYRNNLSQLQKDFSDLIIFGGNTTCLSINPVIGQETAKLRARYNLSLTDAIQVSAALYAGCEAFLTNDRGLKRVTELRILILEDLEL